MSENPLLRHAEPTAECRRKRAHYHLTSALREIDAALATVPTHYVRCLVGTARTQLEQAVRELKERDE